MRLLLLLVLLCVRRLHCFAALGLLSPAEETETLRVYAQLGIRHTTFCRHMLLRLQKQQQEEQQQGLTKADALQQQRMRQRVLLLHFLQQLQLQHRQTLAAKPELTKQLLHAQRSLLLQPCGPTQQQQGQQQEQQQQQQQQQQLSTADDFLAEAARLAASVSAEQQQQILSLHAACCSSSSTGGLQRELYRHRSYVMGFGAAADSEAPRSYSEVLPFVSLSRYEALQAAGLTAAAASAAAAPAAKDPAATAAAVAEAAAAGETFYRQKQHGDTPEAAQLTTGHAAMILDALLQVNCCCCCCFCCCCSWF